MKKYLLLFSVLCCVALVFNSCKQCNKTEAVTTNPADTIQIPALEAINAQIQKDSLNAFLYYKRAKVYEVMGDFKSATTDMFLALSIDSLRPEFYLYAADLFKKSAEPQRGIALMNLAIAGDSTNTAFFVKAAELAYIDTTLKGNYAMAMSYLDHAIQSDLQNADIFFFKGNIYKEMRDTVKAIKCFQTATDIDPKYYNAYVQIGLLLSQKNDKSAEKYFDNAIKVSKNPEDALYAKADLLKVQGVNLYDAGKYEKAIEKLQQAIETFKKVIELNHRNVEAYMGVGFSYYQMDSVRDAYEYYGLASDIAPTYAGAYFSKGLCAEDLGRTQEAMALYQSCLNLDPDFTRAKEHLENLQKKQ